MNAFSSQVGWMREVFLLEIRRMLAYRGNFWLLFAIVLPAQMAVSYWLWAAMFEGAGKDTLGGFSFGAMVLYYLLLMLMDRLFQGDEWAAIARDIYTGALTKYLIYPISFIAYRWTIYLAQLTVLSQRVLVGFLIYIIFFGLPPDLHITAGSLALAVLAAFVAANLFFFSMTVIELFAFWADTVWTFLVMERFVVSLLGGGIIPLTLFPEWAQTVCAFLPFKYMLAFPVNVLVGKAGAYECLTGLLIGAAWAVGFALLCHAVLRAGRAKFTGVGI